MSILTPFCVERSITRKIERSMKTTKVRIDMTTRDCIDTIRDNRFGPARPSIRETVHIIINEELDRLEVDEE